MPIALTGASIIASKGLSKDAFEPGDIQTISHANNAFLPSYLGYFFVSLSIPDIKTLIFVYLVLFAFTYKSQALYFNPLFLLYGYSFYDATTRSGTAIFLITKSQYRIPSEVQVPVARRINGYTFFERNPNG
ncbi:hypothetical protein ACLM5J_04030 [Nocardioides sp. Bht2]|uniref:hypothetical protein n=1 Tax=Nocardioides sp. Bht2 TaxID=3392297 RepID=UPI0039B491BF